jgi:hypothetical protein
MPAALLGRFAKFYNGNFDRRPIPTLMVTNGLLNTIADLCVSRKTQGRCGAPRGQWASGKRFHETKSGRAKGDAAQS